MDQFTVKQVAECADILQVGTRNMQNFYLLRELGKIRKPVLQKGMSATVEEWLMAAEYIMSGGNYQVILCERGSVALNPIPKHPGFKCGTACKRAEPFAGNRRSQPRHR